MSTRMRRRWLNGVLASAAIGTLAFVACTRNRLEDGNQPGKAGGPYNGLDFATAPPGIESAFIEPLAKPQDNGNALLTVEFDRDDARIGKSVPVFPHGERVDLRDDGQNGDAKAGDRVFSAVVRFDFDDLKGDAAKVAAARAPGTPRPIFIGRQLVGIETPAFAKRKSERFAGLRNADLALPERFRVSILDFVSTVQPEDIDPVRSLVVTAPVVVTDPKRTIDPCMPEGGNKDGVWTFKHLVTEMVAGTGVNPADFVESWLLLWNTNQTEISSGFDAEERTSIVPRVLKPWPRTADGKLDLDQSPFRLSAIVNRIDLGKNSVYGGGNAGEGRFVFGVLDRTQAGCHFLRFSVIFEYGIPRRTCHEIRDWAQKWVALSTLELGSPSYNSALESITEEFVHAGAAPGKPNGSALNQLRTNENALNSLWELREFKIDAMSHLLFEDTTKQTPDETLNKTNVIGDYINGNVSALEHDAHTVLDQFPGTTPFMAATSRASVEDQLGTHFNAPNVAGGNNNARFHFSLNTCSGCHMRETRTPFLHIDPTVMPAALSRFMTGATPSITDGPGSTPADNGFMVLDPVDNATLHPFDDIADRREKLANVAGSNCLRRLVVPPLRLIRDVIPGRRGDPRPVEDPRVTGVNIPNRMVH